MKLATGSRPFFLIASFLLISAVTLISYSNTYNCPFFFDDSHNIVHNPSIIHISGIGRMFFPEQQVGISGRPVLHFTFALNRLLLGPSPAGYRAVNVALHIFTALFLAGITARTLRLPALSKRFGSRADILALICALLWAAHPIQTESVTYITNRGEVLACLAISVCLYGFIRARASGRPIFWCALSWFFFAVGAGTKEITAAAPILIFAYEAIFFRGDSSKRVCRFPIFYLGFVPGAALLAWLVAQGATRDALGAAFTHRDYAFSQGRVIVHYLYQIIWPQNLCLDWNWPKPGRWEGLISLFAVFSVLCFVIRQFWRSKPAAFLGVCFFVILAPSSSLVPLAKLACDYRMYLPLYPIVCFVVIGFYSLLRRHIENSGKSRIAAICIVTALTALFTALSHERNTVFADETSIWQDVLQKDPNNPRAYQNLGFALAGLGRTDEALAVYEQGNRLFPENAELWGNMGHVLEVSGRTDEAVAHYRRALELNFALPEVHFNLGNINARRKNYAVAAISYEMALRVNPHFKKAWLNLGNALLFNNQPQDAIGCYREVLRLSPGDTQARNNLADAIKAVEQNRPGKP